MATPFARSSAARLIMNQSKALITKSVTTDARRTSSLILRSIALASLGSVESLMPLHSAIASARLKSSIAVDSSYWSWLSQDFAVPR
ncbi:uncharacterized protein LOC109834318 [Asparagus officinalis]|uniref:uncharacterized protein LOC109834318 n=1 Tax=Asparagus officinalis TaxID=4686 RepID=UPI00098E7FFF|nr:uncharacterized protein LOC109834318 [Asparagus officinalis]